MGTREPTADELRLVEIFNNALLTQPQHGGADACALHLVRAIIDGIRPMTERQWEDLPGLGKPWRDLSSREVWECFLESLSPKIQEEPPPCEHAWDESFPPRCSKCLARQPFEPQYPEPGDRTCDKVVNESFPAARCILKLGHAGACDDGIPF